MATFDVHLSVGLTVSGVAATGALLAGLASGAEVIAYFALGALGSTLPDLDAEGSATVRAVFTLLALALAFALVFRLAGVFPSVAELVAVWVASYLLVRGLGLRLCARLTVHRGLFHSLPAAALAGVLSAVLADRLLGLAPVPAWLGGSFVTLGYGVHLLVDELASINLYGLGPRRSLGTALKLYRRGSPLASAGLYLVLAAALLAAPTPAPLARALAGAELERTLGARLLPQEGWFAGGGAGLAGLLAGAGSAGAAGR